LKTAAVVVLGAGIVGALHTGKVPATLAMIQGEFGLSLMMAGALISVLQIVSASVGLVGGAVVDRIGQARAMCFGLTLLGLGGLWGALAEDAYQLLASRVLESLGLVFAVLPGPSLMRQVVPKDRLMVWMGWWSAYVPLGIGLALFIVPLLAHWRLAWLLIAALSLAWALAVAWTFLRASSVSGARPDSAPVKVSMLSNARQTLQSLGPWLLALGFCFYAGQFMGMFGFLPKIYEENGLAPGLAGGLTGFAVLANAWGNVRAGRLAQRGVSFSQTIIRSSLWMIVCAWLTFEAPLQPVWAKAFAPEAAKLAGLVTQYLAVLCFSAAAGYIPACFFNLCHRVAPSEGAAATTVGFMQQGAAIGQLLSPVLIAWVVTVTGGWRSTWWVTASFALAVMALALVWRAQGSRSRFGGFVP
jgi:MFS transporter, CP family, cyanate transporter